MGIGVDVCNFLIFHLASAGILLLCKIQLDTRSSDIHNKCITC